MRKKKYDAETKAAVLAELLAGQAVSFVANEYNIPEGTVKSWKRREIAGVVASDATQKQAELGPLLLTYMQESMKTLIEQVVITRDRKWILSQSAESMAVLMGVQIDKVMRMIEALNRAESSD